MKKTILILSVAFFYYTNCHSQNSVKPSMNFNIWSASGFSLPSLELGVDYEIGLNNQLGINGGLSYSLWLSQYADGGILSINGGLVYYIEKLNNGMFVGGDLGLGFTDGIYFEVLSKLGYSVELSQGRSFNPNIGIGLASVGDSGFRYGGLLIAIGASYSIGLR